MSVSIVKKCIYFACNHWQADRQKGLLSLSLSLPAERAGGKNNKAAKIKINHFV